MDYDNVYLLGVAKVRAVRILALVDLFHQASLTNAIVLTAITDEAQAILSDKDILDDDRTR